MAKPCIRELQLLITSLRLIMHEPLMARSVVIAGLAGEAEAVSMVLVGV